ncbi:hypothetical protein [Edaphobacillus lindanitolerans]|uniref:Uncharacterized protein n=1 Tax=Edaphobacillus lindanitolerans TaxID=550447 RepID=A0A1U7PM87_9BACI|nr:hypothetical protein [Edaphobacillus lindanitolerans]SIT89505.1 hypothetical protein SAMN05428946_2425 [Edaphobacillus lindanitolerans]
MINAQRLYQATLDLWTQTAEKLSARFLPIRPSEEPERHALKKIPAHRNLDDRLDAESMRTRRWL